MLQYLKVLLIIVATFSYAADRQPLAVVYFTDSTQLNRNPSETRGRGMAQILGQYLENNLIKNFIIVEREKLYAIRNELQLAQDNMMTGRSAKIIGNLTQAKLILTGTIVENSSTTLKSNHYGRKRTFVQNEMAVIFKILNTATGQILMTQEVREKLSERVNNTTRKGFSSKLVSKIASTIAKQINNELRTLNILETDEKDKREILIDTNPANAMVEINGVFIGHSPVPYKVFPEKPYQIRIKKNGYWEVQVDIKLEGHQNRKIFEYKLNPMKQSGSR